MSSVVLEKDGLFKGKSRCRGRFGGASDGPVQEDGLDGGQWETRRCARDF